MRKCALRWKSKNENIIFRFRDILHFISGAKLKWLTVFLFASAVSTVLLLHGNAIV